MKRFWEKNKIVLAILGAGLLMSVSIYEAGVTTQNRRISQSKIKNFAQNADIQKISPNQTSARSSCQIEFPKAKDHIGDYCRVDGKVDHVYVSHKGTAFLDFCKDYKTCPFSAVIFASDISEFSPQNYNKKDVEISGLITTYRGRAEIIIRNPDQLKIQ